jgi:kumamolisin
MFARIVCSHAARVAVGFLFVSGALCAQVACGTAELTQPDTRPNDSPMPPPGTRFLTAHVPEAHALATPTHRLQAGQVMPLALVLTPQHEAQLDTFLQDLYDPRSPQYGHYLTPEQFAAAFHPAPVQLEALRQTLLEQGYELEPEPHGLLWGVKAPVSVVEDSLGVRMHAYVAVDGRKYHAPEGPVRVPEEWPVAAMLGLYDSPPRQAHHRLAAPHVAARAMVNINTGIRRAYNVPATAGGNGQVLSLFQLDGYLASDIATYTSSRNIPQVPLKNILVNGFSGTPQTSGGQTEVTLDIELMNAMAPLAKQIRVYEAANSGYSFILLLNEMANPTLEDKLLPSLIGCSWGLPENVVSQAMLEAENALFKQMAAQGQSFFAASGDSGATADGQNIGVGDPSSQPWVVGVGGTKLYVGNDGSYVGESTWAGGGGGISAVWPIPTWQANSVAQGSLGSTTMRNVPDVALNSDPNSGYVIVVNGQWLGGVGGTSCAAPLWTAFMGVVNSQRAEKGIGPVGFVNPLLYSINNTATYAADFHDINDQSTNGFYPAVPGYDQATGWGSFNGGGLLMTLSSGYARQTFKKPDWY